MLRVVVLTADPRGNPARITDYLLRTLPPDVQIVGAIIDASTGHDRARQRRRIVAWRRQGGIGYVAWRLWLGIRPRVVTSSHAAYARSLHDLGTAHGFPVIEVPNVNGAESEAFLRELDPDVALSMSNRVIYERIFEIPRQGMINLHHGRVPDFRGGPPALWELYDGCPTMGVTVHRIDQHIDHGEVLAAAEVPVEAGDDQCRLMERAYTVDYRLVEEALRGFASGTLQPLSVSTEGHPVRTFPSLRELRTLRRRLGKRVHHDDHRLAPLDEIPAGAAQTLAR